MRPALARGGHAPVLSAVRAGSSASSSPARPLAPPPEGPASAAKLPATTGRGRSTGGVSSSRGLSARVRVAAPAEAPPAEAPAEAPPAKMKPAEVDAQRFTLDPSVNK